MDKGFLLPALLLIPILGAGICILMRSPRGILRFCAAATILTFLLAAYTGFLVYTEGVLTWGDQWLRLDILSVYHCLILTMIFLLTSLYSILYFDEEIKAGTFVLRHAHRFGSLWMGTLAAMILVLISNNVGVMWVGVEASTLLTAFLICTHNTPTALEAMWKYLLMCSVGVALAFAGTLLMAASAHSLNLPGSELLLWTTLIDHAGSLNPLLLKISFIFLVVGFGTKTGLAPMHTWLPDAHSQAPSPVSAVFSGFLLNTAFYCILKYLPIVETATGNTGWGREILVVLGLLSILIAAIFIVAQHDVKRLLAYSSVEHVGIMALGIGLGGIGYFAALFHILNHSLCKTLSFFSAGILGQRYRTLEMRKMTGILRSVPVWGIGLTGGLLALIGMAPSSIFISEFMVLRAALDHGSYLIVTVFLLGLAVVFVSALRHLIYMAWEPPAELPVSRPISLLEIILVAVPLIAILTFGLWMPDLLADVLTRSAQILKGAVQ